MGNMGYVNITGYCLKERTRRQMLNINVEDRKTKRGIHRIASGVCEKCGCRMAKFMKKGVNT